MSIRTFLLSAVGLVTNSLSEEARMDNPAY
jgi:hypothetical protein